ncbi:MAG: transposase [Trichodesmium sp. MAG_R03]|nr:transposase [Trichodesmium sp. MAG_R03]
MDEASAYASWAESFKVRVKQAISTWSDKAGLVAGLLLKSLRDKSHQWWYFLDHPQVPPDNNRAQRSLRLAVTKCKVGGGSRSWPGFYRLATMLPCDTVLSRSRLLCS